MKKSVLRAQGKIFTHEAIVEECEEIVEEQFEEVIEEIQEEAKPKGRKKKEV